MGALLGLVSGGALSFAAGKYREKEQQKQQLQQMTLKGYMDDAENSPEVVNNPEWEKAFRKSIGDPEAADAAMMHFKVHAAEKSRQQEQLKSLVTGLFGGGTPQGPQGAPTPTMTGAPSTMPASSVQPASTGTPQQDATPTATPATDYHAGFEQLQKGEAAMIAAGLPPDEMKSMQHLIDDKRKDLTEQMKAAGHLNKDEITPYQQANLYLRGMEIKGNLEDRQIALGLQQQNKEFMERMDTEKQADARQAHFQTGVQQLGGQTQNIAKMLSATSPADASTVKTLLQSRNATARMLKQQADKYGIEYDPEQFKPLTTQQIKDNGYFGTGIGATEKTTLTEDSGSGNDPLIGKPTSKPDGTYDLGGKHYTVKGGKIVAGN